MSQRPSSSSSYNRQGPNGSGGNQQAGGGRWDAIIADRKNPTHSNSGNNSYQRTGSGVSGNYNNRNNRDNNGSYGGYGGQRDNNYGRRDQTTYRPFHSHVGGQSGDTAGADWNTPLPANPNLER
jgi:hypothetical protein